MRGTDGMFHVMEGKTPLRQQTRGGWSGGFLRSQLEAWLILSYLGRSRWFPLEKRCTFMCGSETGYFLAFQRL